MARRRLIALPKLSREALQRMLKHPEGLGNPFPRGTLWHRTFDSHLEGLAKGLVEDGAGFEGLPLDQKRLVWLRAVIHVHQLLNTAEVVTDAGARARNENRTLAWLNSDLRAAAQLARGANAWSDEP